MERINYKHFVSEINACLLSPIGIDTHAHLSSYYFGEELDDVLLRACQYALSSILSICLNEAAYEDVCRLYPRDGLEIYSAVGIHPCDVLKDITTYKNKLSHFLQKDIRIKAIGETGLDYHWKNVPYDVQKKAFIEHIALAKEYHKPLILHAREAEEDVFTILLKEDMQCQPVIWHCYGGTPELAQRIVDNGWYISFAGNITYPNAHNLREALRYIPREQLLIETDSPYLAPQPKRGHRNEPAHLMYIAEVIALELDIDVETLWSWTSENAQRVLAL